MELDQEQDLKRALLGLFGLLPLSVPAGSLEEQCPAPWIKADNPSITRALSEADVGGFAKYRYRVSSGSKTEFLVYCLRGSRATQAFMVWPNIHKLMGPYPPDPSLQ